MIRNLEKKDFMQMVKVKIMYLVTKIIKGQNSSSLYILIFFFLINFFSLTSILFVNDPLYPQYANQVFKVFILSNLQVLTGLNQRILLIIVLIYVSVTNLLIFLNFMKDPLPYTTACLGYLVSMGQIFIVPLVYYTSQITVQIFNDKQDLNSLLYVKIITVLLSILLTFQLAIYTYFEIRPFRTSNLLWSLDNMTNFYKAIVICIDKISIIILLVSLIIQIKTSQLPYSYLHPKTALIVKCRNKMVILLHISLIIGQILQSKQLCLVFLCISLFSCIFMFILQFFSLNQSSEQIPKCCFQNCMQIYGFYIEYRDKNRNCMDQLLRKISTHFLICNSDICIFKDIQQLENCKLSNQDLQQKISKFLKYFRYKMPQSQLLYQIWKIQLNKTISLTHNLRDFILPHRFVVQFVLGPQDSSKKDLVVGNNNGGLLSDSANQKYKFYKQVNCTVDQFQRMAEVMCKPLPELNQVIDVVIGIHQQTGNLTKYFDQMIKTKEVNYFCIQLYLKFFENFLDESKLSSDILDRLKRLKAITQSDFIQQVSLPCFLVQSYSKNIQKVNAQALKFLRANRYQVKDKNFGNIIVPSINLKDLYAFQTQSQKQQFVPIFFKSKSSNNKFGMICRNVTMKSIQINNKNYYQIIVHKKNNGFNTIEILINSNQQIVASTVSIVLLPSKKGKIQKTIEQIYEEYVKDLLKQVSYTKIARVQLGQKNMMTGLIIQKFCPYPQMRLISISLIKKINHNRNQKRVSNYRLSRLYNAQKQFSFYYRDGGGQDLVLEGSHCEKLSLDGELNNTLEMRTLNQRVSSLIANMAIPNIVNYSSGIKVYRLYQNDLYNIDLQDKARYQQQFGGLQTSHASKSMKVSVNQNLLIALLILITILICSCSIVLIILPHNSLIIVQQQQYRFMKMQQFSLNFNRIMSIIRDVANGIYTQINSTESYQEMIMGSYKELVDIDSASLFTQEEYSVQYRDQHYRGGLSQLIEVCLARVYDFVQFRNRYSTQDIHNYAIKQIDPIMLNQKYKRKQNCKLIFDLIQDYSLFGFLFILIGSILYFVLYLILSQKFKKNMNTFLQPLLIISDQQIRRISEQCQKFKNIIVSLYKNYQVDLQSLRSRKQIQNKRVRPKRTNFGLSSLITEIIFGGFLIISLISVSLLQFRTINDQIYRLSRLFEQTEAVIQVYTGLSWVVNQIDHINLINRTRIQEISAYLTLIQNRRTEFQFTPQLSNLISTVFFENSCDFLFRNNITKRDCKSNIMKGFTIQNPFELSLDLYFRRMNYDLIANLTDTFGCTGIYSNPFTQLFLYLSRKINEQITGQIVKTRQLILIISIFVSILSFSLIAIFLLTLLYFKRKIVTINNGLVSFNSGGENTHSSQQISNVSTNMSNNSSQLLNCYDKSKGQIKQVKGEGGLGLRQQQIDQVKQY